MRKVNIDTINWVKLFDTSADTNNTIYCDSFAIFKKKFILWYIRLKIGKFTSLKQYFFGLFSSRNAKKTYRDEGRLEAFLLYLENIDVSQFFQRRVAKKSFRSLYLWYNLLRWMFFIPCDNWKTLFFIEICHYPEVWCNCYVAAFFESSLLKEVRILCRLYPQ